MRIRIQIVLGVFLLLVCSTACVKQQSAGAAPPSLAASSLPAAARAEDPSAIPLPPLPSYRLRPGDVMELNFPFTPEFNQAVTVQPDGYISLRGLNPVHVRDKTVPETVEIVKTTYTKILRDPVVTAELKDFEKPYFIVTGEVARPGKYDLRGETTVLQAVAVAGDVKREAKGSQILLFRRVSEEWVEVREIDLKHMLNSRNLSEDPALMPGDVVFVPKTVWAKFDRLIPAVSFGAFLNPFSL